MFVSEKSFSFAAAPEKGSLIEQAQHSSEFNVHDGSIPIRFAVTASDHEKYDCEVGYLDGVSIQGLEAPDSIFRLRRRKIENTDTFNAIFVVPTGIGAEIGGHVGDATPVVRMLSEICDHVITHPNVVNASDINEATEKTLYVEGSVISRLMAGTVGLQKVRSNRVLVIMDSHPDKTFEDATLNSINAAKAAFGLNCPKVLKLEPRMGMRGVYTGSGRATGEVSNFDILGRALLDHKDEYDAVAITSIIDVPVHYHLDYFLSEGEMVNPWGGVEAILTHAISELFDVPSAHSPMMESKEVANLQSGVVEPRMAAEAISLAFFHCVLKGLHNSPRIITDEQQFTHPGILAVEDVSCLVIPDGCLGLPTMAALEQGIPVIAVRENKNLMRNDLTHLPWATDQFYLVDNYWEAAGVMASLKGGVEPTSMRRPIERTTVNIAAYNTAENRLSSTD